MHESLTQRWNSISLRNKITGVTVLLLTLGLLVAGVGTMTVLRNYLLQEVDNKIESTAETLNITDCTSETQMVNDYFIAVISPSGGLVCHNKQADPPPELSKMDPDDVSPSTPTAFSLWDKGRTTQWRVVAVNGTNAATGQTVAIVLGVNLDETDRIISQYAGVFFGFGLSAIVLGAALTRLLVTSTFAPLRQVEATAAAIANGNFSERLPGATPNTEVGRLNRSLNTMLARIDRAFSDRARTIDQMRRFVGDASHELRTPLVSVRGYAELYRMGALTSPDEVAQAMERIEKEAIRMGELVQDLLELARIDESKPVEFKPVDLVPIAYDAALDAMASAPDRTIDVIITEPEPEPYTHDIEGDVDSSAVSTSNTVTGPIAFAGAQLARLRARRLREDTVDEVATTSANITALETPAVILGAENKIRQVVTNLLGNAMRFTNPGSPIEIAVSVDSIRRLAMLDIIDHGDGVPPQIREKIFQRFWRADSSRARETGGNGLGLAIVAGIVIAHHGTVEALETDGGGATFRVILPLLPRDSVAVPYTARA